MAIKGTVLTKEEAAKASFAVIENGIGTQAVHDTVVAYRANRRTGTACTKTKAEVNFSGVKPWRQKGTGRARAGYKSSPIWRKGGVVFGPKPRDFSKTTPVKVKRLALRKALSTRILNGDVLVVDQIAVALPKTREFVSLLKDLKIEGTALFVNAAKDENVLKASRNLPDVQVTSADDLNAEHVLRYDRVVFTQDAFKKVTERVNKR